MKNKVTLITPPDFFENSSLSLCLINLKEQDQELITSWLAESQTDEDINLYYYNRDQDAEWLLSSINKSELTFIDIDESCDETSMLLGYILSKPNVYFKTIDQHKSKITSLINTNRVPDLGYFLNETFNSKLNLKNK